MKKKRCLILGGSGFLGKHLCKCLLENDYDVCVYGRHIEHLDCLKKMGIEFDFVQDDFVNWNRFDELLRDVDFVFHLISTTNPSNQYIFFDIQSNVLPTIKLLDSCKKNKIEKLIYFSSGGTVYGIPRYIPIDEGHRTQPISPYGIHKLTIEKCIEYYGRSHDLNYAILRISNPYGAGQNPMANQGAIAVFLAKAIMDQAINVWGSGNVIRDYIFIDDVIEACIKTMQYEGNKCIFNIGSGKGYSLNEIIYKMQKQLGKIVQVNYLPGRIQDVPENILDIKLMEKEMKWKPKVSINDGITSMIDRWDNHTKCFRIK